MWVWDYSLTPECAGGHTHAAIEVVTLDVNNVVLYTAMCESNVWLVLAADLPKVNKSCNQELEQKLRLQTLPQLSINDVQSVIKNCGKDWKQSVCVCVCVCLLTTFNHGITSRNHSLQGFYMYSCKKPIALDFATFTMLLIFMTLTLNETNSW